MFRKPAKFVQQNQPLSKFKKMIEFVMCNKLLLVVRILVHWYWKQTHRVKRGRDTSSYLTMSNGDWQGEISSPFVFVSYTDYHIHLLRNSTKVGCHINNAHIDYMSVPTTCVICHPVLGSTPCHCVNIITQRVCPALKCRHILRFVF